MKQALYFGVLSVLLAGCSQFKTNKQTAPIPINLESHVQALDENAQAEDVPTPTPKIVTSNSRTMLLGKWYGIRTALTGLIFASPLKMVMFAPNRRWDFGASLAAPIFVFLGAGSP